MIRHIRRNRQGKQSTGWICVTVALLGVTSASVDALAQDLTPRTYWPAPKDTRVLIAGYAHQTGDVVTDPTIPVTGIDSTIDSAVLAYQHTIDLFGRTGNFQLELPYVDGTTTGMVGNEPGRLDFGGFGDIAATLTINLRGAPTMSLAEFHQFRQEPRPILGASFKIVAPTGEYESDRLVNIGTNRWALRLQLGYIQPLSPKWLLEMSAGVWFFQDNDEFLGKTRGQDPLGAFNFHLVRRFSPGFWASLDLNYYFGGHSSIDGSRSDDLQRNARAGLSLVYPLVPKHALKLGLSGGIVTESGGDFRTITLNYIYVTR